MKLSVLITINAVLLVASGIAFALYGPLMMAVFSVPDVLNIDVLEYWQMAAFARMFGAALFGYGLLLLSLRGFIDQAPQATRRGVCSALVLANVLGAIVSITQQSAIWQGAAGWLVTAVFIGFALAYAYFLATSSRSTLQNLSQ
jgi:hypothetical protein